jgi:hypothetical protein
MASGGGGEDGKSGVSSMRIRLYLFLLIYSIYSVHRRCGKSAREAETFGYVSLIVSFSSDIECKAHCSYLFLIIQFIPLRKEFGLHMHR